jgi:hypothetical protein
MERVTTNTGKEVQTTEQIPTSEHQEKHQEATPDGEKTHEEAASKEYHHDEDYHLKKENTLGVDTHNEFAIKGDESDGKISWTPIQFAATICLAGLYVGKEDAPRVSPN